MDNNVAHVPSQAFVDEAWKACQEFIQDLKIHGRGRFAGQHFVTYFADDGMQVFAFPINGDLEQLRLVFRNVEDLCISEFAGFGVPCYYICNKNVV